MAPTVADRLPAFLARAAKTRFDYGTHDCLLWLADWLMELGRDDPAKPWRGGYSSELGAARLLVRHGGHIGLLGAALGPQSGTDAPGDVGVVEIINRDRQRDRAGAIRTGLGWAVLRPTGLLVSARFEPVATWEGEHG